MVRILESHWENVSTHESLLRACFHYLLAKYPDPEGAVSAWDYVLLRLYEMSIFSRFDPTKHPAEIVDKKFQQFIYKWVEQILNNGYNSRMITAARNRHGFKMDRLSTESLATASPGSSGVPDALDISRARSIAYKMRRGKTVTGVKRAMPTLRDAADYVAEQPQNPLEKVIVEELWGKLMAVAETDIEKKTLFYRTHGYKTADIAEILGQNRQTIDQTLKRLRIRYMRSIQDRVPVAA